MKIHFLPRILTGISLTLATLIFPSSTTANPNNYICAQLNGVWTTWSPDIEGERYALVHWKNNKISNWPPRKRCIVVSQRINRLVNSGTFNHMSGGFINGNPVVCGVRSRGGSCTKDNTILTLPRGYSPNTAIQQLTNISYRASGKTITLSGNENEPLMSTENGQTYVNVDVFQEVLKQIETPVRSSELAPVE